MTVHDTRYMHLDHHTGTALNFFKNHFPPTFQEQLGSKVLAGHLNWGARLGPFDPHCNKLEAQKVYLINFDDTISREENKRKF
jgi:hypothetical protein